MTFTDNLSCTGSISPDNLIALYKSGHTKLVPLKEDGVTSMPITDEDKKMIKAEGFEINEECNSWYSFIYENPTFWTIEKLEDP